MYRFDKDSFSIDIALEWSGLWNKIDFFWQVRCPICAENHEKCADRKQARIIKGTRATWILQCPLCAYEARGKTAAMCLGNIIGTYGSQSIQGNWDEGWQKVFKNKNRKYQKSRSKGQRFKQLQDINQFQVSAFL